MAMMESVRGRESGRSGGRENGVEGVFTSHHEVQVRIGHMAEAAVEDDGQRRCSRVHAPMISSRYN